MNWLSKMERKYGKYAIRNLTLYLIICYGFGYVIQLVNPVFFQYLTLNPYWILQGQVWRLVTWILIPPARLDFFTLIMLYFYYSIGTAVERAWGTFRYNVYLISGLVFTVIGAFVLYLICLSNGLGDMMAVMELGIDVVSHSLRQPSFSTYYVCMSIILAFAMTFPEVQILLMFIIPIKIKVLGIIYAVILGLDFFGSFMIVMRTQEAGTWYEALANCIAILFSLMSTIIFFVTTRKSFRTPRQIKRQAEFKKQVVRTQKIAKHKCAICGRTAEEYPDLEFRFCSKCDGNYEYCSDHLFTHTHVKK
ncbi:MAG: hypothetical protein E7289_00350 [Lachnospiraceae bacterium]|nr:hypothetical protein [Lachnospiraceae bacterium]